MAENPIWQRSQSPIQDPDGPFGACHMWGCHEPGEEVDLLFHEGEGDESPQQMSSAILCVGHHHWFDGRELRVVSERLRDE